MRKVISGHVYDNEKAHMVGTYDNGASYGDLNYVCETLYRTKSGLYFIYAEGGANTRYAETLGNNLWASGESISPIELKDAQNWAEEHLTGEEYEAEWGNPDEGVRVMSVRVSEATYQAIKRASIESGKTMGDIITELVK